MKTLQHSGGVAALYLALINLSGMVVFLVVLDYPSLTTAADRVKMLIDHQSTVFLSNLLMYVGFGVALIIFSLTMYDQTRSRAPGQMRGGHRLGDHLGLFVGRQRHGRQRWHRTHFRPLSLRS